jgi:hypothetical protein
MANEQVLQRLPDLRPESGRRLPDHIITGMTQSLTQARYQLYLTRGNPSGPGFISVPRQGVSTLLQNLSARRRLQTIPAGPENGFTQMLNTELLGGDSYPILTAVLGTAAGVASGGAGLLFTIATTAIDSSRTVQRVLARPGDELWQVEEIGKIRSGSSPTVIHVGSYFLVDPYRGQAPAKGWLIHEERQALTL